MKLLILTLLLSSCAPEFSPWQDNVDNDKLTQKNLDLLKNKDRIIKGKALGSIKIAIVGDPQVVFSGFEEAHFNINDEDVDFTVVVGDLTDRGLKHEWELIKDTVNRFNEPIFTVVGNHDGLNKGDTIYKRMFGPLNYSFMYKGYKVVMWNNNKLEWGSPDFEWLDKETQADKVIVVSHQPPYSGTMNDNEEERWRRIRQGGAVIASVHGHMHHYNLHMEDDVPIYTVERVENGHYGMLEIRHSGLEFFNCDDECYEASYE